MGWSDPVLSNNVQEIYVRRCTVKPGPRRQNGTKLFWHAVMYSYKWIHSLSFTPVVPSTVPDSGVVIIAHILHLWWVRHEKCLEGVWIKVCVGVNQSTTTSTVRISMMLWMLIAVWDVRMYVHTHIRTCMYIWVILLSFSLSQQSVINEQELFIRVAYSAK